MSFLLLSLYSIHISGPETTPNPRNLLQPSQAWICMRQFRLFWDNVHIWYSAARTVGWSNLALFCDCRKWTHCCRSDIFKVQFKQIGEFRLAHSRRLRGKVLIFFYHRDLHMIFFQIPSFYIKEQLPKRKFKNLKVFKKC